MNYKSYLRDQWMCGCCYGRLTGFYYKIMTVAHRRKKKNCYSLQPPVELLIRLLNHEYFFFKSEKCHLRQASFGPFPFFFGGDGMGQ